jgi:protein-S-isoprenylcysteine O-methyltransferase Ste14
MEALANTPAAAAPAPAPGPAPAAVLSNESGAEDLARVMSYVAWVSLAGVQAAVLLRAGSRLSCAGSGEAVVAPVAIAALLGASSWGQSSSWGEEHATLRMPLHAQVAGVVVGFVAAALFASTHWHLGARATRCAAAGARHPRA